MNDGDVPPDDAAPPPARRRGWRAGLRRFVGWGTLAYVAAAFTVTHVPLPDVAIPRDSDKLVHLALFAPLALLLAAWRVTRRDRPPVAAAWSAGLCLLYAAGDELTQQLVPGRSGDPFDFLADAVGTGLGLLAFVPVLRWYRGPT